MTFPFIFRLLQAEEEIENLKKVEPMLRKELDICHEVSSLVQCYSMVCITIIYLTAVTKR